MQLRYKVGLREIDKLRYSAICFYTFETHAMYEHKIAMAERVANDLYTLLKLPVVKIDVGTRDIYMNALKKDDVSVHFTITDFHLASYIKEIPNRCDIVEINPFVESKYQYFWQRLVKKCEELWQH